LTVVLAADVVLGFLCSPILCSCSDDETEDLGDRSGSASEVAENCLFSTVMLPTVPNGPLDLILLVLGSCRKLALAFAGDIVPPVLLMLPNAPRFLLTPGTFNTLPNVGVAARWMSSGGGGDEGRGGGTLPEDDPALRRSGMSCGGSMLLVGGGALGGGGRTIIGGLDLSVEFKRTGRAAAPIFTLVLSIPVEEIPLSND